MKSNMETNLVSLNPSIATPLHRRDVLRMAVRSTLGLAGAGVLHAQSAGTMKVPLGLDAKTFERQHQHSEFERSVAHLRRRCLLEYRNVESSHKRWTNKWGQIKPCCPV